MDKNDQKATAIWDSRYDAGKIGTARKADDTDPIDYTQHSFLHNEFISKRITGVPSFDSYKMLLKSIFNLTSPDRVLAVGSGLAHEEQQLVEEDMVRHVDAYELSDVAAKKANERIKEAGLSDRITVHAGDVTKAGIADCSYDVVFVNAAIHHFFNIEEMMDFFYDVLKPGGLLVYNEYVGPDHHMYHDKVMDIADKINLCLDDKLRFDELRNEIRPFVPRATLDWMMEMDPSEGVHATQILPLTYKKFDVVQRFDTGGTIMRPFWVGILRNFDFSNYKDQSIARLIGLIEELLIDCGEIPSYHTLVAARKGEPKREVPQLDNEVLSRKTHDYETEKLITSIFRPECVASCAAFSDENWEGGVIRGGPLRLLVPGSRNVRKALNGAKRLILGPSKTATIDKIEEAGDKFVLNCSDETFQREEIQYPAKFWICEF